MNPQFTLHIEDMNKGENQAILHVLYGQVHVPEYQFRSAGLKSRSFLGQPVDAALLANDYDPDRRRVERRAACGT